MTKNRLFMAMLLIAIAAQSVFSGDKVVVVGQNVQNFFYSLDRGRTQSNSVSKSNYNTEDGRTVKLNAIINALSVYQADIYAFNEIEVKVAGSAENEDALVLLAQAMSTKTGKSYAAVKDDQTYNKADDDANNGGAGAIRSGFIYNTATVETVGDNVTTAVGYSYVYPAMMRMQAFKTKASGEVFTLSMNHFKASTSNISDDIVKREQNSISLLQGLEPALDPDILVLGDMNSEMGEQCLNNLVDAGYEEQILKRYPNAFTHYYDDGELIDHAFANSTMAAQVSNAEVKYVANKHSVGKNNAYSDHDPYVITLNLEAQDAPKYGYKKVTTMTANTPYLMVAPINGLKAAKAVTPGKKYEFQLTEDVTDVNGVITMDNAKNAIRFESDGNGNYYIKDYYGRYFYQFYNTSSSKYNNSTNVGDKANAHAFSVTPQGDGTFKILNTVSSCYFLGLTYKGTPEFAMYNYATLNSGQYLPWLYEFDSNAVTTGIETVNSYSQPTVTRKVMENGRLIIVTADGMRYNIQGMEMK